MQGTRNDKYDQYDQYDPYDCTPEDPADADDIGTALREAQVGFKVTHY